MVILNEKESVTYTGGAKITAGVAILITSIVSFVMGLFEGFSNPKACNNGR